MVAENVILGQCLQRGRLQGEILVVRVFFMCFWRSVQVVLRWKRGGWGIMGNRITLLFVLDK